MTALVHYNQGCGELIREGHKPPRRARNSRVAPRSYRCAVTGRSRAREKDSPARRTALRGKNGMETPTRSQVLRCSAALFEFQTRFQQACISVHLCPDFLFDQAIHEDLLVVCESTRV
jgi:hypothetical protein